MARMTISRDAWGLAHRQGRLAGGSEPYIYEDASTAEYERQAYSAKDDLTVVAVRVDYSWQE